MKFFALVLLFAGVQVDAAKLGLRDVLRAVQEKAPAYQSLKLARENAVLTEKNAWWSLAPQAELQATHQYFQSSVSLPATTIAPTHLPFSNQLGLSITENLYDNGETWRQGRIASLLKESEVLNLERGRGRLLVDVAKSYYDFALAVSALEMQRRQLETLRNEFRSIENLYRQGTRSNRDYLRARTQVQTLEIGLVSQETRIDEARANLRIAIGETDSSVDFESYEPADADVRGYAFQTVDPETTYDFRIAKIQDNVADIRAESIRRDWWPRVSVKAGYNYVLPQYLGPRDPDFDQPYWDLQSAIVLEYHLWDWGTSSRKSVIADNAAQIDKNLRRVDRLKISEGLTQLKLQAERMQKSFELNRDILKAAEDAYRSVNIGYREGKISYLEMITALNDLYSTRQQNLDLRFSLLKLRAELSYYQGNVDETLPTH